MSIDRNLVLFPVGGCRCYRVHERRIRGKADNICTDHRLNIDSHLVLQWLCRLDGHKSQSAFERGTRYHTNSVCRSNQQALLANPHRSISAYGVDHPYYEILGRRSELIGSWLGSKHLGLSATFHIGLGVAATQANWK